MSILINYSCSVLIFIIVMKSVDQHRHLNLNSINTTVISWANHLSRNIVELSDVITRRELAMQKFAKHSRVLKQEGPALLDEIASDIREMMKEKVNAVKRIKMHAEALSCQRKKPTESAADKYDFFDADDINSTDGYEHYEFLEKKKTNWLQQLDNNPDCDAMSKKHKIVSATKTCPNEPLVHMDDTITKPEYRYLTMKYHPQYEEEVNLNFSVIRSAVSVFVRDKVVINNIRWSEPLDLTFKCNTQHDPSLTWQYFASSSGFMRLYPAMRWPDEDYDKTYDHRTRSWYTEAMTSPKDLIILLDRSGSMEGIRREISKQIVHDILDTLADNDYVNVLTFANSTTPLVECFNNTLVQANEENLRLIRESLLGYEAKYSGDLVKAFETAFGILKESHVKRSGDFCTQVIMVIAEGLDYFDEEAHAKLKELNVEDVHERRVRIFTYQIGTLESDAEVMLRIACENMGYHVNISSVAEIREKVNKYTNVLSRSVNLEKEPELQPIWSALYVDLADRRITDWLWHKHEGLTQRELFINYTRIRRNKTDVFTGENKYAKYMAPRKNRYLTTVSLPVYDKREGVSTLLGVAAVDVPIDYMNKLTKSYKLGVNGYAFVITNNGYVLMHPDHRTNFKNIILKPTFNRVDLTEVELSNATTSPRDFDERIVKMREMIIDCSNGTNNYSLDVMTHMEDMKRIFFTTRQYHFTRIEPYTLVIALQDNYGFFTLEYNVSDSNFNPLKIFLDRENQHWVMHPDWMYFKQMKNITREFAELTPKEKLKIYLMTHCVKLSYKCKREKYFDLLRMFLIDLESTDWFEEKITKKMKEDERYFAKEYLYKAVTVAFLSTHTGLTRWQHLDREVDEKNFGRVHNKSIDEIWYRRVVEENKDEHPDMYILAVPLDIKNFDEDEVTVTVTHALFLQEKSPISVVGYEIRYSALKILFQNIDCENRILNHMRDRENVTCIIVDNHGYIFYSENTSEIGQLILQYNKNLTQHLEDDKIFQPYKVFDYQGICFPSAFVKSCPASKDPKCRITVDNVTLEYEKRAIEKQTPTPCDKEMRMYRYTYKNYFRKNDTYCHYIVQHIPDTNLALLIYATDCYVESLREEISSDYPKEKLLYQNGTLKLPCHIETKNSYYKRPYIKCITAGEYEKTLNQNAQYCGGNQKKTKDEL